MTSDLTSEDFIGLLIGEVSGNWNPSTHPRPAGGLQMSDIPDESRTGADPIIVSIQPIVTAGSKEIVVPVNVDGVKGKDIISYEFNVRYDPAVMRPSGNPIDIKGTVSRGLFVVTNPFEPGLLRVVVYGAMPIDQNGVLLNLRFTAVGPAGSVSPLIFERIMLNEGNPEAATTNGRVELYGQ